MEAREILDRFCEAAENPGRQKERYLAEGKKVVLMAPVYTPEEIIHSMGMVPMAAWGADVELKESKKYFPAFICSIMQSILEIGMAGIYQGVSAIVIPSLCDSLKVLGQNWKYAVKDIPFIPMTYPQNRHTAYGREFVKAGYESVIRDLEAVTGAAFDDARLKASIAIYNAHNQVMRELAEVLALHSEISAADRSAIYKSAGFMLKEEHTALVRELITELEEWKTGGGSQKIRIVTTGILADSPSLLEIIDSFGFSIVADDVAAESRQYRTDAPAAETAMDSLAAKFCAMDNCSVLYDARKKRVQMIAEQAKKYEAAGVLVVLTKFCDPEEFDYPLIKKACEAEGIHVMLIEVDRQMTNYEQARILLEGFRDMLTF